MANQIQIKRSLGAGATATPGSLNPGELAYTSNGGVLFIGNSSAVVPVAGNRTPGVSTANQALVTDANNQVDHVSASVDVTAGNSSVNAFANSTIIRVGNSSVYSTINSSAVNTGSLSVTSFSTTDIALGANVDLNTTRLFIGNTTANLNANSVLLTIANSTGTANLLPTQLVIGSSTLNSTALALSGKLTVGANVTLDTATLSIGNSSANHVANSVLVQVANSTGTANLTPTQLVIGSTVVGGNVTTTNINASANVNVSGTLSGVDAVFSGNLTVLGSTVSVNTTQLQVNDPTIKLADNNQASDAVDAGFYSVFGNSTVTQYTGLARIHGTSEYQLFTGAIPEPTTTIPTSNVNYAIAQLKAYLNSGALVSNAATVSITANSTVNVNIVANTLSLSTALPGTSGGTGLSSYTTEDILVANSTNGFRKLSKGADGTVLQISGTSLVYASLDGGSF